MSALGLIAILFGLSAGFIAFLQPTRFRVVILLVAYLLHIVSAVAFYQIAQSSPADADLYYYDPFDMYPEGFGFGTQFVLFFVQSLKSAVGGTYLDYFLLFQAFGFFGIAMMMRIFEEVYSELGMPQPIWTFLLLLIPSLHYWSSAVGKDAPFFFATALAVWAAMAIRRRLVVFGCAVLLMLLIRPHIAAVALVAVSITVLADRTTKVWLRLALAVVAVAGAAYSVINALETFNMQGADAISDRLASREQFIQTEDAGRSVVLGPLPVRILSLLFRPFFFDARDLFGIIASFENIVVVIIMLTLVFRLRTLRDGMKAVPFMRYGLAFALALILVLGWDYYNVGLGLRQKWTMIMPSLLALFVAVQAIRASRRRAALAVAPAASPPWATA